MTVLTFLPQCSHRDSSVKGSLTLYVNCTYSARLTIHPVRVQEWQYVTLLVPSTHRSTRLLFLQIPKQVSSFWNSPFQRGYFSRRRLHGSLVVQKELPLLRRQQLPVATVKLLQFWWFSRTFIVYVKSSITSCWPRRLSKPSSTLRKRSKNVKRTKEQLSVWLIPVSKMLWPPVYQKVRSKWAKNWAYKIRSRRCHIHKRIM